MPVTTDIEPLVPHAGAMVLIDAVASFDDHSIECRAHLADPAGHPLSRNGVLPATALAEYGAQTMAVHGGLRAAAEAGSIRRGMLAGLNRLALHCECLDQPGPLEISAQCELDSPDGLVYAFQVCRDGRVLAQGQATVMFPETTSE